MSTLYEIVELPDGEIVLQRLGGDDEPLLRIRFSHQARAYMDDGNIEVAKAMVEAGIRALSSLSHGRIVQEPEESADDDEAPELEVGAPQTHLIH